MDEYSSIASGSNGSLRLKGGLNLKKKKKSSKKEQRTREEAAVVGENDDDDDNDILKEKIVKSGGAAAVARTAAEIAFEKRQKERQKDRISKLAQKSHKEKVQEFNRYLSELSEHNDVPKVGPG